MRTIFTNEDVKNLVENLFNGNLRQSNLTNATYVNPNSEEILITDLDTNTQVKQDLAKYLNINFYSWKQRLVEQTENLQFNDTPISLYDSWLASLNYSMNEAYALVEVLDEEVTASQDIDSATKICKITFIMQTNKIKNLDYYVTKIRNKIMGLPQKIQNSYGDIIDSFILLGSLIYEEEPTTLQFGECVKVSIGFKISYLNEALSYTDTKVEISLDGDDLYDESGNVVNSLGQLTETKYLTMPITKITWQQIFTSNPLPTVQRPDLTGFVASALTTVKTLSFFDFNKPLSMRFNDLFWSCGAFRINGKLTTTQDINIPVYVRITSNGKAYVYKDMIDNIEKVLSNSDFNISSITLKGWGKLTNL